MAFVKNDVTDEELDNLFNKNDNSSFVKKEEKTDELISPELDVKNKQSNEIERPDGGYKKTDANEKKEELKETIKNAFQKAITDPTTATLLSGVVNKISKKVISELVKKKQQAYLEEYKRMQQKIPMVAPTAKLKLYGNEPECKYHVYRIYQMIDNNNLIATCKFCSHHKQFTLKEWSDYQIENYKYM